MLRNLIPEHFSPLRAEFLPHLSPPPVPCWSVMDLSAAPHPTPEPDCDAAEILADVYSMLRAIARRNARTGETRATAGRSTEEAPTGRNPSGLSGGQRGNDTPAPAAS